MITIKKYGNRRLYDSSSSRYINLEDVASLIRSGESIQVVDARTGEDLTRPVLLQVIMETQGGFSGFPTGFLHRLIRYGGDSPLSKVFMQQVSMGLDMLDMQISQFEGKFRPITPVSPPVSPVSAPEPEPPPEEDEVGPPSAGGNGELTALRDRLAALEKRLGGKK